jgi:hypothetical protein
MAGLYRSHNFMEAKETRGYGWAGITPAFLRKYCNQTLARPGKNDITIYHVKQKTPIFFGLRIPNPQFLRIAVGCNPCHFWLVADCRLSRLLPD